MKNVEAKIIEFFGKCLKGSRPSGLIKCEATAGSIGLTGALEAGLFFRKESDFHDLLRPIEGIDRPDLFFSDLIRELREVSVNQPDGPWYRCNIEIRPAKPPSFRYFLENTPFNSIKELEPDISGHVPDFVFRLRFDKQLIDELSDFEVGNALPAYVSSRLENKRPVTAPLMRVFAVFDWLADVRNGAMDQYFARGHGWGFDTPKTELCCLTYQALVQIGHKEVVALFAESIALFAHFHPHIDDARQKLNIPALERQESSDIMSRFYELDDAIEAALVAYIRKHISELEQG